jgi:Raf kinase inhibitor-like YbhB/YbcL family protein
MHLRAPAFSDGAEIPRRYTADGDNLSPPLEWDDVPGSAKSLALIVEASDSDDPSVPASMRVHWLVVDLPPESKGLTEGVTQLPAGVIGVNEWERSAWNGPSSKSHRHHYVFKLYAIDRMLGLERPTKYDLDRELAKAIVLAEATLTATYGVAKAA